MMFMMFRWFTLWVGLVVGQQCQHVGSAFLQRSKSMDGAVGPKQEPKFTKPEDSTYWMTAQDSGQFDECNEDEEICTKDINEFIKEYGTTGLVVAQFEQLEAVLKNPVKPTQDIWTHLGFILLSKNTFFFELAVVGALANYLWGKWQPPSSSTLEPIVSIIGELIRENNAERDVEDQRDVLEQWEMEMWNYWQYTRKHADETKMPADIGEWNKELEFIYLNNRDKLTKFFSGACLTGGRTVTLWDSYKGPKAMQCLAWRTADNGGIKLEYSILYTVQQLRLSDQIRATHTHELDEYTPENDEITHENDEKIKNWVNTHTRYDHSLLTDLLVNHYLAFRNYRRLRSTYTLPQWEWKYFGCRLPHLSCFVCTASAEDLFLRKDYNDGKQQCYSKGAKVWPGFSDRIVDVYRKRAIDPVDESCLKQHMSDVDKQVREHFEPKMHRLCWSYQGSGPGACKVTDSTEKVCCQLLNEISFGCKCDGYIESLCTSWEEGIDQVDKDDAIHELQNVCHKKTPEEVCDACLNSGNVG